MLSDIEMKSLVGWWFTYLSFTYKNLLYLMHLCTSCKVIVNTFLNIYNLFYEM